MDKATETTGSRTHVEIDGRRRFTFNSGKPMAPAGVHINDRRRNDAGTARRTTGGDRGFKEWPFGRLGRSQTGERPYDQGPESERAHFSDAGGIFHQRS